MSTERELQKLQDLEDKKAILRIALHQSYRREVHDHIYGGFDFDKLVAELENQGWLWMQHRRRCAECGHLHTHCSLLDEWPDDIQPGFPYGEWMCHWCMASDYANDPQGDYSASGNSN